MEQKYEWNKNSNSRLLATVVCWLWNKNSNSRLLGYEKGMEQKYELLQSNSRLFGCERVMETRAEFHFSWVYTFSATLSSLRN